MVEENEKQGQDILSEVEEMLGKEAADRLKELKHGDSIFGGSKGQYESILRTLAKAAQDPDKDYRQALLLSTFLDREDATTVVAALDERRRYGVDITPVVDLIHAWAAVAGARGGRVESLIEGQTHQSITSNLPSVLKNQFKKKDRGNPLQ